MLRYEIKKVFSPVGSKIALLLIAACVIISIWSAVNGHGTEWVNEEGISESGYSAIQKIRSAKKEWAGPLDSERLTEAILENQRIEATPEAQSKDIQQNNIAFGWKQGISDIRNLVSCFMSERFNSYNYYLADSISVDILSGFYVHRVDLLKDHLYGQASNVNTQFTPEEKAWLVNQYEALEAPMKYDYFLGWDMLLEYSITIIMLLALILGYLVAGIFSCEFKLQADSIYFSTSYGRNRGTGAKIQAGFWVVTAIYWVSMLIYSLVTLAYLGFDGWDCPVQLQQWQSFYNTTFLEAYILVLLGGYLGHLFSAFLAMWISSRTRSAVVAVTVPFLLIFLPNFLQNYEGTLIGKFLGLLPDQLLQISNVIRKLNVYSVGNLVTGAVPLLLIMYALLTMLLIPVMYRDFSRKELL